MPGDPTDRRLGSSTGHLTELFQGTFLKMLLPPSCFTDRIFGESGLGSSWFDKLGAYLLTYHWWPITHSVLSISFPSHLLHHQLHVVVQEASEYACGSRRTRT